MIAERERLVQELFAVLRARTGLSLSLVSAADLETLAEAAARGGLADLVRAVRRGDPLPEVLVRGLVISETYFQRHADQLAFVRDTILPGLAAGTERKLGIVSAGCSTGEEPYSLAILAHEAHLGARTRVVGLDLSPAALAAAALGRYRAWSLRDSSGAFVEAYFRRHGDAFEIAPWLRERVRFAPLNLAAPADRGWKDVQGADLVLCRNVLIYMEAGQAAQIATRLLECLRTGGWLMTGPSDPPLARAPGVQVVVGRHGAAYHKTGVEEPAAPRPLRRVTARPAPARPVHARAHATPRPAHAAARVEPDERAPEVHGWVQRVQVAADERGPREAEALVNAALAAHPVAAELHFARAALRQALLDTAGAIEALERVLFLDRTLAFAHVTLCALYQQAGRVEDARRAGRTALRLLRALAADHPVKLSGGERAGALEARVVERLRRLGEEAG